MTFFCNYLNPKNYLQYRFSLLRTWVSEISSSLSICTLTLSKVFCIWDFVVCQGNYIRRHASPLPIAAIFSDETFQLPWFCVQCNFPHYFFVDLDPQTRPLEGLNETVFDRECFWVCHVAADVVLAGYSTYRRVVRNLLLGINLVSDSYLRHCSASQRTSPGSGDWECRFRFEGTLRERWGRGDSAVRLLRRMLLPLLRSDEALRFRRSARCLQRSAVRSVKFETVVLTWLYDINRSIFKEPLEVPPRVQSLSKRNRTRRLAVELFDPFRVLA
jgi:hypothetical protein